MNNKLQEILLMVLEENDLERPSSEITENTRLREDLSLDSFHLALLTVYLEEEFGVDVFEDGIVNTVGEIIEKIEKNADK